MSERGRILDKWAWRFANAHHNKRTKETAQLFEKRRAQIREMMDDFLGELEEVEGPYPTRAKLAGALQSLLGHGTLPVGNCACKYCSAARLLLSYQTQKERK